MKRLFVGNLAWKASEDSLRSLFEQFGEVVSVKIVMDQYTGRSKGFAFVEMQDEQSAQQAVEGLDNQPFLDRPLRVSLAMDRPRQDRPPRREGRSEGGPRRPRSEYGSRFAE